MNSSLTKAHGIVFAVLWVVFMVLAFRVTNAGLDDGPEHNRRVFLATAGMITGPLAGAIARGFQGCCLRFSLAVMACCAPLLLLGLAAPFVRRPDRRWLRVTRLWVWTAGWLAWFIGGLLSFGHALS